MTVALRVLVILSYAAWQGGFFFYAAVVVPIGTDYLESARMQGAITQRVTHWLNFIGVIALVVQFLEMLYNLKSKPLTWWLWRLMVVSQVVLYVLHAYLDNQFIPSELTYLDRSKFKFWHGVYLWTHTVQWLAGMAWVVFTVKSWTDYPRE